MFIIAHFIVFELQNEVESLSKIQYQNIVSLLGYCIHGEARFLVYEMMENGSLELHLHGNLYLVPSIFLHCEGIKSAYLLIHSAESSCILPQDLINQD